MFYALQILDSLFGASTDISGEEFKTVDPPKVGKFASSLICFSLLPLFALFICIDVIHYGSLALS